jgi:ABC-type transport system involved in cytochrome c biogenesis permease subunit
VVELHQLTAALYLAAGLAAALGLVLPAPRASRLAVALLVAGFCVHGFSFLAVHRAAETPSLTSLPAAISSAAWMAVLFFLPFLWRARLAGLVVLVAPLAFLGVFAASLGFRGAGAPGLAESASWSHLHVLLASGGLALLALAGLAGFAFMTEHRSLKAKRGTWLRLPLPSLEALDRVNRLALSVGFLMLTLGLVTGVLWVRSTTGALWPGTPHAYWMLCAWGVYAALVAARFAAHQGARASALSAVAGFGFLLFAVVGVGVLC